MDFVELAQQRGGACLASEYVDSKSKLSWRCRAGHQWDASPQKIKNGQWCPICSRSTIRGQPIEVAGVVYPSLNQAAASLGIADSCVRYRLAVGWSAEQAFGLEKRGGARTGAVFVAAGKEFPSLASVARHFDVEQAVLRDRLKNGWEMDQAIGLAPRERRNPARGKFVVVAGRSFHSVAEAAKHFGVDAVKAGSRIRNGWTPEQALGVERPPVRKREYADAEEIDGRIFPCGTAGSYKLYLVTNAVDNKEYVGITLGSLQKRWGEHQSMGPSSVDTKLKRAIRKHGLENFKIELLRSDATNYKELMTQEIEEIERRGTYEGGYNSTRGGEMVFNARAVVVGEMVFPTLSSAAEHFGVDEALIRARIDAMGWSIEEAVGLTARPNNKYSPRGSIEVAGQTFATHKAAAASFGIDFRRYSLRINRYGWSPEQALGVEPPPNGPSGISVAVTLKDGQRFKSLSAAETHFGITSGVASHRVSIGWSLEQALGIESKPRRRTGAVYRFSIAGRDFSSQREAAEYYGVDYKRYNARVKQKGWTPAQALGIDPAPHSEKETFSVDGLSFDSIADAAKHFSVPRQVVYDRLKLGWDFERALKTVPRGRGK
jgi:hypothetical protein